MTASHLSDQVPDNPVPVATQSSVSNTDPNAPTVNTIEFRDTGVVLQVTPRVNTSGIINLEIEQEVSDVVSTTTSGIDSPTIQQRKVSSHVVVKSGESITLGGMIRDSQTDKESGLPVLSGLPVIGKLFGNTDNDHKRTELLIIITPRIARNSVDAREITNEFKQRLKQTVFPKPDDPETSSE
ncbi:type II secretion system protein GspD [Kiloniella laminariae]|uniref:type II secretion system protein GspD n=1 Tax=Kiloniella laminariae TaxID=454162 RepID=UPI000365F78C|nr:type II and III secretion system protein [Kiloniella laminariae]